MSDIFHTFFGISGLLLLHYFDNVKEKSLNTTTTGSNSSSSGLYDSFDNIDPTYALPTKIVKKLGLKSQILANV